MIQPPAPDPSELPRQRAQEILLLIGRVGHVLSAALGAQVPHPDLARNLEVVALTELDAHGPLRPTQIQELTGLSSGGVTKLLDRLEQHGLIERSFGRIPSDRRAIELTLTPEGHRVAGLLAEGILSHLEDLRMLAKELDALLETEQASGPSQAAQSGHREVEG